MVEIFKYVNREQLRYSRIRCYLLIFKKRRYVEDNSVEHRKLRIVDIDIEIFIKNFNFIAIIDYNTSKTNIASKLIKAKIIEHRSFYQDSHKSSNKAITI